MISSSLSRFFPKALFSATSVSMSTSTTRRCWRHSSCERRSTQPKQKGPRQQGPLGSQEVLVSAGPFVIGTDTEPWSFDNERPAHVLDLPAFWIDSASVTNAAYIEFIEAGGYQNATCWSDDGWEWRRESGAEHPGGWKRDGEGGWSRYRYGTREPVPLDEPVQHVCWYEADAYSRWASKRLPTEAEWEKAASWDAGRERKRRFPWGDDPPSSGLANLGHRYFRPAAVGAYPGGASPWACHQMIGDVWEWDCVRLRSVPGLRGLPLPGVLRGLLRIRVQGPARRFLGYASRGDPEHLPKLGLPEPRSDLCGLSLRPRRVSSSTRFMTQASSLSIDVHLTSEDLHAALRNDALHGLQTTPKGASA